MVTRTLTGSAGAAPQFSRCSLIKPIPASTAAEGNPSLRKHSTEILRSGHSGATEAGHSAVCDSRCPFCADPGVDAHAHKRSRGVRSSDRLWCLFTRRSLSDGFEFSTRCWGPEYRLDGGRWQTLVTRLDRSWSVDGCQHLCCWGERVGLDSRGRPGRWSALVDDGGPLDLVQLRELGFKIRVPSLHDQRLLRTETTP